METDVKAILFLQFLDWVMQSLKLGFTWFNPPNPPKCEYTFFSICYYVKMPIAVGILGKMNYFPDLVNLVIASGRSIDWELQQWDPSDHLVRFFWFYSWVWFAGASRNCFWIEKSLLHGGHSRGQWMLPEEDTSSYSYGQMKYHAHNRAEAAQD